MVSTGEKRILTEPELLKLRLATEVKDGREVVYGNKGDSNRGKFPGERRWIYAGAGRMRLARGGIFGPRDGSGGRR